MKKNYVFFIVYFHRLNVVYLSRGVLFWPVKPVFCGSSVVLWRVIFNLWENYPDDIIILIRVWRLQVLAESLHYKLEGMQFGKHFTILVV